MKSSKKSTPRKERNTSLKKEIIENKDSLNGLIISVTGFQHHDNNIFKEKIEKLGGIYSEDLLKKTDILIVNKINTAKAIKAQELKKFLVTKDYLNENNKEKYLDTEKSKPECFLGIDIFLYGFNDNENEILTEKINKNKGEIINNPESAEIIVIKNDLVFIDNEIEKLKKYQNKIVTEIWIENCIKQKEYIKYETIQLSSHIIDKKYDNIIENIKSYKYKNLFLGIIFGISEFKDDIKYKLINLISFCNGIYFDEILENTNYVIVPLTFSDIDIIKTKKNVFNKSPLVVNCNWIFDTITKGYLLSPKLYKPIKSVEYLIPKLNNKNPVQTGNFFKGKSFSIMTRTFNKKEIEKLKAKIIENMGEYFDANNSENLSDYQARFIIVNDGNVNDNWNKIITDNSKLNLGKNIVSHRFIEECINRQKLIEISDYFDLIPLPFKVPLKGFDKMNFYLHEQFSFEERIPYERLIETLGGHVDELNKQTTHILLNSKTKSISKHSFDKLIKQSNKNVKCVNEEFLMNIIIKCGECNVDEYLVKIESK